MTLEHRVSLIVYTFTYEIPFFFSFSSSSFFSKPWEETDDRDEILRRRIIAVSITLAIGLILIVGQIWWVDKLDRKLSQPKMLPQEETEAAKGIPIDDSGDQNDNGSLVDKKSDDESDSVDKNGEDIVSSSTKDPSPSPDVAALEDNVPDNTQTVSTVEPPQQTGKKWQYKHYCLFSVMINSFLIGGLTFGYSGMVLILREEGVFAGNCAVSSFDV